MIESSAAQQVLVFVVLCFIGFFAGIFFDLFKAIKNAFQLSSRVLFLIDLLLSLLLTIAVFQILFQLHWGEVRIYVFVSFFCGIILYYFLAGRYVSLVFQRFFRKCLKIVRKIFSIWKDLHNKSRIKVNRVIKHFSNFFRKEK